MKKLAIATAVVLAHVLAITGAIHVSNNKVIALNTPHVAPASATHFASK